MSWPESLHSRIVGPEKDGLPFKHTVVWTVLCFMVFLTFGVLAACFPTENMRYAFLAICFLMTVSITVMVIGDLLSRGNLTPC